MNQYDLEALFDLFDQCLGIGRTDEDPRRLRANQFMLVKIEQAICTFVHLETRYTVQFDPKAKRII